MNARKVCDFVNDPATFKQNIRTYDYQDLRWLSYNNRTNEIFIVLDNTEFYEM